MDLSAFKLNCKQVLNWLTFHSTNVISWLINLCQKLLIVITIALLRRSLPDLRLAP